MVSGVDSSTDGVVLYVEDQPVNALLMELLFERLAGPRLVVATSVEQARRIAPGLQPRLLLLDLRLPDGDGVGLLAQLRQLPAYRGVAAVAVTAESDFSAEGSGFIEIWRKPLNVAHVLARLAHFCGQPVVSRPAAVPQQQRHFHTASSTAW